MNYLAHAYLSFNHPAILVGNMISDFVKGRKQFDYPREIQMGISLHRAIDEFTDHHPATMEAKQVFKPVYRLYSGAFVDVVYDHFLANDETVFAGEHSLAVFAGNTYDALAEYEYLFPPAFKMAFTYMRAQNWLYNYQYQTGIQKSFAGLERRAKYLNESQFGFDVFLEHYTEFQDCYYAFFPALKDFARSRLSVLQSRQ